MRLPGDAPARRGPSRLAIAANQPFPPPVPISETTVRSSLPDRLATAIRLAQGNLLRLQHTQGYWCGELFADSTLCSDYVAYMHWAEQVDPVLQEKCVAHIQARQQADGGWNLYEGGPSDVNATVKAYFALKLAGHKPAQQHMQEARACVLRLGGIPRMNTYSKLYLALLGQFPWERLPTVPVEMIFFPKILFFNIYEMSSWSRAMLMPLALLNHFKPTRHLPEDKQLHELYPVGTEQERHRTRWHWPRLSWPNFFLFCDRIMKLLASSPKPWRDRAIRQCKEWMLERMGEGSEGLAAIYPAMLNAMIALKTLGYRDDDPVLAKAKKDFEGLFVDDPQDFRIQPCLSPVWDTAINLIALMESGLDPKHPDVQRAVEWLKSKEVRRAGDWTVKNPGVEPSGWAFEFDNDFYPDTDDTMMVLGALSRAGVSEVRATVPPTTNIEQRFASPLFARALRWLMSFQCKDGGWAAFDKDVTKRWLEDVPFADHNAILDPTCSDLTGRVLELLGHIGWPRTDRAVQRALRHIRRTQEPDGSWYGRWGVNYIYGTWQVLRGLRSIGEDMRQDWIVRAKDWLESCQNEDGGWGETCASYDDPTLKGKGASTASQTAWALMGLIAAADASNPAAIQSRAIQRGLEYLLSHQNADGSWSEPETTGTGFPRVFYLRYDMYRNNWPLLALATYHKAATAA